MKKTLLLLTLCASLLGTFTAKAQEEQTTINLFDQILFYDGYAAVVTDPPAPEGYIRHRNDSYATKITDEVIESLGNTLTMNIKVNAACDNYDRIAKVNLAFVPTGSASYNYNDVERIEIARFITPFMNKNVPPNETPYTFSIDNVAKLLKDENLTAQYDFWIELEIFGVPYAAQTQIAGCAGRIDTFFGTLDFVTGNNPQIVEQGPNSFKKVITYFELKNYDPNGTDLVGQTVKTVNFTIDEAMPNAKLYLISSNHGANDNGEEYNRRNHYVYFDDELELTYKPGGKSCEPYRQYNTQGNGIYGSAPRTLFQWASFSNWCPGDIIPIRVIELGDLEAGEHKFKIEVPDAVFANGEGYIPVSAYLQGYTEVLSTDKFEMNTFKIFPNPVSDVATIATGGQEIKSVSVVNTLGQTVYTGTSDKVDMSPLQSGIYIVNVVFANNAVATNKIVKK
jgi:hypothetical protein